MFEAGIRATFRMGEVHYRACLARLCTGGKHIVNLLLRSSLLVGSGYCFGDCSSACCVWIVSRESHLFQVLKVDGGCAFKSAGACIRDGIRHIDRVRLACTCGCDTNPVTGIPACSGSSCLRPVNVGTYLGANRPVSHFILVAASRQSQHGCHHC